MVKVLANSSLVLSCLVLFGCEQCSSPSKKVSETVASSVRTFNLETATVQKTLGFLTDLPHPMSSSRQVEVRDYIVKTLQQSKLEPLLQPFTVAVPNKNAGQMLAPTTLTRQGFNIHSRLQLLEHPECIVALASHYDSKDIAEFPYVGANDGASSSALLLDLARHLTKNKENLKLRCDIELIWFDGEEATLPDWNQGLKDHPAHITDNTYGSRFFADAIRPCACSQNAMCLASDREIPFTSLVLLDMVGYKDLKLTPDQNSHPRLASLLFEASDFLNIRPILSGTPQAVVDDHIPIKAKGIPVLDIIDFNHLDLWHTPLDRPETVAFDSLEISGKLALYVILSVAQDPVGVLASDLCSKHSNSP